MKKTNPPDSFLEAFALYGGAGFQLSFCVVVGLWLGSKADSRWHTDPWLMLTGLIVGVAAGFWNFLRIISIKEKH